MSDTGLFFAGFGLAVFGMVVLVIINGVLIRKKKIDNAVDTVNSGFQGNAVLLDKVSNCASRESVRRIDERMHELVPLIDKRFNAWEPQIKTLADAVATMEINNIEAEQSIDNLENLVEDLKNEINAGIDERKKLTTRIQKLEKINTENED